MITVKQILVWLGRQEIQEKVKSSIQLLTKGCSCKKGCTSNDCGCNHTLGQVVNAKVASIYQTSNRVAAVTMTGKTQMNIHITWPDRAACSCVAGKAGMCSHVVGLLKQIIHYVMTKHKYVPGNLSCTQCRTYGINLGPSSLKLNQ